MWSFGLMVSPLLALGAWVHAAPPLVIGFFCLYALFSGAPGILEWGYPNELFPTRIRAAAVGTFLVPVDLTGLGVGRPDRRCARGG